MKLKEYLKALNDLAKANPKTLEMDVLTSIDDEGNAFNLINYTASVGHFDGHDFIAEKKNNAICLN